MLLGCVYIPPENSKYSSEEAFIEVEDELLFFSRDHKNIALAGDFNSDLIKCKHLDKVFFVTVPTVCLFFSFFSFSFFLLPHLDYIMRYQPE
jgi:hypothetical protein